MKDRPILSKAELKKMFLRVLYECQYGKMKSYSFGVDSIVPHWINDYYKIELYPQEKEQIHVAIQELKNSGLIAQDPSQMEAVFQRLTEKGKELVENQQDPDVFALRLEEVIKNQDLLSRCIDSFNNAEYETAVFNAFKFVEESVRLKAGLGASDFGVALMDKALNANNGKLVFPTCAVTAEQSGIHGIFRGAVAFLKNPSSHRTVNYDDRHVTIQAIALADFLLNILSTSKMRES